MGNADQQISANVAATPKTPRHLAVLITDALVFSFRHEMKKAGYDASFIFVDDDDYDVWIDLLEGSSKRNWGELYDSAKDEFKPMPLKAATDQATLHGAGCADWAARRSRKDVPLSRIMKELKKIKDRCPVVERNGFKILGYVCDF